MSDQSEYKPPQSQGEQYDQSQGGQSQGGQSQGGQYNKEEQPYEPAPPKPCPDPCETPRTGPPKIDQHCCPPHTCCPEGEKHCCTWEDVDDPCVRAASACNVDVADITCKCESSNEKCCEEWDCGCYPELLCVPCQPCAGLIPDPKGDGECVDPDPGECTTENLSKQLDALTLCISSQQNEKAKLEADIKARGERANALNELIKAYDDIIKKYREARFKLICKEDCLKGFYRDVKEIFVAKYTDGQVTELTNAINSELCLDEMAKCCQKNLEEKLTKVTKLKWKQQQAETEMKKADQAFTIIKDLPKWIEDRFKELETLRDEIENALKLNDPEKDKWALYLFYWKFVPKFCKCFPITFCCEEKKGTNNPDQNENPAAQYKEKESAQNKEKESAQNKKSLPHLGCKPGDWHPSAIDEKTLKGLICCAWEYARNRKEDYLEASKNVADVNSNLDFIKKKVEGNAKTFEDRIKSALGKVNKPASTST